MIVRNNSYWTRLANHPRGMFGSTCPVNFDFSRCKTIRVVYWRSDRDKKRHCILSPGRY